MIDKTNAVTPSLEDQNKVFTAVLFALLTRVGGKVLLQKDEIPLVPFRLAFRKLPDGTGEMWIELESSTPAG